MPRHLIVADPHLGVHDSSDSWHNITVNLFKAIVDTASRTSIDSLVILGDFFNERKHINSKTLNCAIEIHDIIKHLNVYMILGNHDLFYKDKLDVTSLKIFWNSGNIKIIDKPTVLENILLVPWNTRPEKSSCDHLMGHFAINDFQTNDNYTYRKADGLKVSDFSHYKSVLSGHFHTPSNKNNITFIGSPYQMNFGDSLVPRGYYIFDDGKMNLVQYDDAPKYIKMLSSDKIKPEKIKGNIIKLTYVKDYGRIQNNKLVESIQIHKPLQLHTDFSNIQIESLSQKVDENVQLKNNRELLLEYIKVSKLPNHINEKTLMEMIDSLNKET